MERHYPFERLTHPEPPRLRGALAADGDEVTYSLTAAGHIADEETERRLHTELAEVLAKPEYGCTSSTFSGSHVRGTIHLHHSPETEHVHETSPGRDDHSVPADTG